MPHTDVPPSTHDRGSDIRERTFQFACRVVKYCEQLYGAEGVGRVMAPQLVNCSTSIAAMLEEARAAESRRDFISKCCVSLKEAREAHVRLRICERSQIGPAHEATLLVQEANAIVAIIGTIVRNTRANTAAR